MNLTPPSEITRRAALGAMAGLVAAGRATADDTSQTYLAKPRVKMSNTEEEYRRLRPLFEVERKRFSELSNTHCYWTGPHGRAIIALGPAIIPQLIQELRKGDFFFNVPLEYITNADITHEHGGSEQEHAKLWLQWWDGGKDTK